MPSIAFIGADGAGKTTLVHMFQDSSSLPIKYLYMGINTESSNVALPTSRLLACLRRYWYEKSGASWSQRAVHRDRENSKRKSAGKLWAAARLTNRLAEEWYRQLLSWSYQIRGYIVLYDRHFLFDFCSNGIDDQSQPLAERLHHWCLTHLYPRPDLVIYLDAPAKVLFARKGEGTLEYLECRRQAFIRQGKQIPNFIQIDATQPLDLVYTEVLTHIMRFYESRDGSLIPSE